MPELVGRLSNLQTCQAPDPDTPTLRRQRGSALPTLPLYRAPRELTSRFGGVTVYPRGPAEGFWQGGEGESRDDLVMFEIMARDIDDGWWRDRRD